MQCKILLLDLYYNWHSHWLALLACYNINLNQSPKKEILKERLNNTNIWDSVIRIEFAQEKRGGGLRSMTKISTLGIQPSVKKVCLQIRAKVNGIITSLSHYEFWLSRSNCIIISLAWWDHECYIRYLYTRIVKTF